MKVSYCDLCGCPMKEEHSYLLFISDPKEERVNYIEYIQQVDKTTKEICPNCKIVFDEIFRLRMQNLNALSVDLLGLYETPTKNPPKKNKKDNDGHPKEDDWYNE